MAIQGKILIK